MTPCVTFQYFKCDYFLLYSDARLTIIISVEFSKLQCLCLWSRRCCIKLLQNNFLCKNLLQLTINHRNKIVVIHLLQPALPFQIMMLYLQRCETRIIKTLEQHVFLFKFQSQLCSYPETESQKFRSLTQSKHAFFNMRVKSNSLELSLFKQWTQQTKLLQRNAWHYAFPKGKRLTLRCKAPLPGL